MALASPSAAASLLAPSWRAVLGAVAVSCVLGACGGGGTAASPTSPVSAAADESRLSPVARRPVQAPALTGSEVPNLASFLRTLTDGYTP